MRHRQLTEDNDAAAAAAADVMMECCYPANHDVDSDGDVLRVVGVSTTKQLGHVGNITRRAAHRPTPSK